MTEHMLHDMQHHFVAMIATGGFVLILLVGLASYFLRPATSGQIKLTTADWNGYLATGSNVLPNTSESQKQPDESFDTLFVLPDISHFTRFMTGSRFALGHARHVIFSLMDAMISAATPKMQLSKIEGDAALFFNDAGTLSPEETAAIVIDIFAAFFRERERLATSNICPCGACEHIRDLDLKIFVHRGNAARFTFQGIVDHFGTDVIVLHRLMKNGVDKDRYVMVTNSAAASIALPDHLPANAMDEEFEHIGVIEATVYDIDHQTMMDLSADDPVQSVSWTKDLHAKVAQNAKTLYRCLIKA